MPDLIIGGSTYKNIDYLKVKKADGKTAVFYDSARNDHRTPSASCLSSVGKPMVYLSAIANSAISTAKMIKEI